MTDLQTLINLRDRVRAATGPDREIDCRVAYAVGLHIEGMSCTFREFCDFDGDFASVAKTAQQYTSILRTELPRFTASLDAIRALTKQLLPNSCSDSGELTSGGFVCWLLIDRTKARTHVVAIDDESPRPTEPLACVEALLTALIRIEENADD